MLDHFKQDIDFGTPASTATEQVTLTIDGQQVAVPKGTSLMRAAVDAGVRVPKLCATDSLEPFGSCRLCLVEVEGRNRVCDMGCDGVIHCTPAGGEGRT